MPVMKQLNMGGTTYDTVGEASVTRVVTTGTKIATITIDGTSSDLYAPSGSSVDPATAAPLMDGTAAVGSSAKYAREDHVHPTDTSRQATLVSGTNIMTINGNSILGSGNLTVGGSSGWTDISNVWDYTGIDNFVAITDGHLVVLSGSVIDPSPMLSTANTNYAPYGGMAVLGYGVDASTSGPALITGGLEVDEVVFSGLENTMAFNITYPIAAS